MVNKKLIAVGLAIIIAVTALCLWDIDGDGLVNILDGSPTQYSFPATAYAREKISSVEVLEDLRCLDGDLTLDEDEAVFIDFLADFEQEQQAVIIQSFLADGEVSSEEIQQIQFLNTFMKEDRVQMVENGSFYNFNWDGDMWSNYFEKAITKTPVDVKNDIFIFLMTMAGREYGPVDRMHRFLEETVKLPAENFFSLNSENNNPEEFKIAVSQISSKADSNDIVFIHIGGHGNINDFQFWNGSHTTYTLMNEQFNEIVSKALIIYVDSCHSGSAIEHLSNPESRVIMTACKADETSSFGITYEFFNSILNQEADADGSGYVSIGEANDYVRSVRTFSNETPQLSDIGNIGRNLYLLRLKRNS